MADEIKPGTASGLDVAGLAANLAMRDLPWDKYLHGEDREAILQAYEKENSALTGPGCVLRELGMGDPE